MVPICVLSHDVVEKIAAGEVVERPASVAKELVENSLDAGAGSIHVEIRGGGIELIRVSDDGRGIPREELPLAVMRHATSKIRSADDLMLVSTLGFRGEALASIGAVSLLTLTSRPGDTEAASQLVVEGGSPRSAGSAARGPGTTVEVEGLFYNVPARRKFLRSAASETALVATSISQMALAYPEVRFSLLVDGRRSLQTSGSGDPLDAAVAVLGRETASALLPVKATVEADQPERTRAASINGLVAEPRVNRSNRSSVWLFVNRRIVRSRALSFAVEEAYETLLPAGRHPVAIIDLQVPGGDVDVNVHPSKSEVKLLRERLLYRALRDSVRESLSAQAGWAREIGTVPNSAFQPAPGATPRTARLIDAPSIQMPAEEGGTLTTGRRLPILRLMGQVAQSYIVAEGERGLYLIDQHAAHERVLYHRLTHGAERGPETQLLLESALLELSPEQHQLMLGATEALHALGFSFEPFGEGSVLIRGVPSGLLAGDALRVLKESVDDLLAEKAQGDWRERAAVALSCRGAVKAGKSLSAEEMRSLLEDLEEADITQQCSHGRPVAILLSHQQLEREFGRK